MAKRRPPNPIKPRRKDERQYEADLRQAYVNPMFAHIRARLAVAVAADQAYRALDEAIGEIVAQPRAGVPLAPIEANLARMATWHRERLIKTFRSALGVSIRPFLLDATVAAFMTGKVRDNVDLIKTIPERAHDGLERRLGDLLETEPFNQQALTRVLRDEFKSSGYNLRRITRDQTSKMTGQLTQLRHQQLGIQGYIWVTSEDERVRPTHQFNNGRAFRWDAPPGETGHPGHDVLCRCVPRAIVRQADMDRWLPLAA